MMVITDYARDLPRTVFVLPQVDESALTDPDLSLVARMVEAMDPGFKRAVAFHVEGLHADEFTRCRPANVFLHAVGERLFSQRHSALIMIELDVVHEKRLELSQVTFVVGIKQSRIEGRDGPVEDFLICDLVERKDVLSAR